MLVTVVAAGALLVVAAVIAARRAAGPGARRWSRWLQWAALAAAAVAAVVLKPAAVQDAGWFAAVLLGVPVVLAALPPLWDLTVRRAGRAGTVGTAVGWVSAVLAMLWALLLALGVGLAFLPAAFLMLAAAAARTAGEAALSSRA